MYRPVSNDEADRKGGALWVEDADYPPLTTKQLHEIDIECVRVARVYLKRIADRLRRENLAIDGAKLDDACRI